MYIPVFLSGQYHYTMCTSCSSLTCKFNAVMRKKLSRRLDACVLDRPCQESSCDHRHKGDVWWVGLINLGFTLLNVFHLAYLGLMFGGSDDELEAQVYRHMCVSIYPSAIVVQLF